MSHSNSRQLRGISLYWCHFTCALRYFISDKEPVNHVYSISYSIIKLLGCNMLWQRVHNLHPCTLLKCISERFVLGECTEKKVLACALVANYAFREFVNIPNLHMEYISRGVAVRGASCIVDLGWCWRKYECFTWFHRRVLWTARN